MRLLWLFYRGTNSRHILLLELDNSNGKLCGLDANNISDVSRQLILDHKNALSNLSLDRRIDWLKEKCPEVVQHIKTMKIENITIINTFPFIDTKPIST